MVKSDLAIYTPNILQLLCLGASEDGFYKNVVHGLVYIRRSVEEVKSVEFLPSECVKSFFVHLSAETHLLNKLGFLSIG